MCMSFPTVRNPYPQLRLAIAASPSLLLSPSRAALMERSNRTPAATAAVAAGPCGTGRPGEASGAICEREEGELQRAASPP